MARRPHGKGLLTGSAEDLANRFEYHPPTPEHARRHVAARAKVLETAYALVALTPPGREQALMLTHLEEALLWANASIARQELPQSAGGANSEGPPSSSAS